MRWALRLFVDAVEGRKYSQDNTSKEYDEKHGANKVFAEPAYAKGHGPEPWVIFNIAAGRGGVLAREMRGEFRVPCNIVASGVLSCNAKLIEFQVGNLCR